MGKKIALTVLFIAACVSLHYFCKYQTDGFQVMKIISSHSSSPQWEINTSEEEQALLATALQQPFHYLSKGRRCYAFVSEDQKYVLKFVRTFQITAPWWSRLSLSQYLFPSLCKKEFLKKEMRRTQDFTGYKMGFERLKEQTGTLFLHLNPTTTLQKNVTLYDKINVKHVLPADNLVFILQKKAEPFSSYYKKLLANNNETELKKLFSEFALLLKTRANQHIADWDLSPRNLGIVDGKWAAFDLDGLKFVPLENFTSKALMLRSGKRMIRKLKNTKKDLADFLIAEIERVAEKSD
jgi:hypothetical protein